MTAVGSEDVSESSILDPLYDVCFVDDRGYAVGYYGTILHSPDGGETWEPQESPTTELLTAVVFVDADHGWISGTRGVILATSDGGKTWTTQRSGTENDLTGIYFLNPSEGWAVGQSHTILRTADGGRTWETLSTGEELVLKNVRFLSSQRGFVVGEFGTILVTEDGGVTFRRLEGQDRTLDVEQLEASHPSLNSIAFTDDATVGIAVGMQGYVLRSSDGGATWEEINCGVETSLFKVELVEGCVFYAAGLKGTVIFSTDNGSHWSNVCLPEEVGVNWFYGISSAHGEIFIVGESGKILRLDPKIKCRIVR